MKTWLLNCVVWIGLATGQGWAGGMVTPADLPPSDAVKQVLDALPAVKAAQAELHAAEAERDRLKAGTYEYSLSLVGQRRNVTGDANYKEWNVALERGMRLPGKANLDARVGEQGVLAATEKVADARHEGARQLLSYWYAARQVHLEAGLWRKQVALLAEQKRIVEIRVNRGDGSQLEALQAEAALSQARSTAAATEARERTALADLKVRFPELPVPDETLAQPTPPEGDEALWLERTLAHNHELLAARHELEKAKLLGRRAEADRLPDPTLGLYAANEQGGRDKIVGLILSVSLPGEARRSQVRVQMAQADAKAEMEAATRRRLVAESAANWQRALSGAESWRQLNEASNAVNRHAELARRANELGELGLSDALFARRTALEAELAAGQARLTGNEASARLMLDAHALWSLDGDEVDRNL